MKKVIKPFENIDAYHFAEVDEVTSEVVSCGYLRRKFTAKTAESAGKAYIRNRAHAAAHCAAWRDYIDAAETWILTPQQRENRLYIGCGNIIHGEGFWRSHAATRCEEYIRDVRNVVTLLQVCFGVNLQKFLFETIKQEVLEAHKATWAK